MLGAVTGWHWFPMLILSFEFKKPLSFEMISWLPHIGAGLGFVIPLLIMGAIFNALES
ncbi:hypothetical protein [Thiocapsa sp. UBA6158]|uniref:hypothetical protein n=1 Tax=Thiocapsa sp. UBA6158 TaxID=1947692 RepID=UPI0025E64808|nr:hypothetical protein [Thiocapsa sp. UBA6158]